MVRDLVRLCFFIAFRLLCVPEFVTAMYPELTATKAASELHDVFSWGSFFPINSGIEIVQLADVGLIFYESRSQAHQRVQPVVPMGEQLPLEFPEALELPGLKEQYDIRAIRWSSDTALVCYHFLEKPPTMFQWWFPETMLQCLTVNSTSNGSLVAGTPLEIGMARTQAPVVALSTTRAVLCYDHQDMMLNCTVLENDFELQPVGEIGVALGDTIERALMAVDNNRAVVCYVQNTNFFCAAIHAETLAVGEPVYLRHNDAGRVQISIPTLVFPHGDGAATIAILEDPIGHDPALRMTLLVIESGDSLELNVTVFAQSIIDHDAGSREALQLSASTAVVCSTPQHDLGPLLCIRLDHENGTVTASSPVQIAPAVPHRIGLWPMGDRTDTAIVCYEDRTLPARPARCRGIFVESEPPVMHVGGHVDAHTEDTHFRKGFGFDSGIGVACTIDNFEVMRCVSLAVQYQLSTTTFTTTTSTTTSTTSTTSTTTVTTSTTTVTTTTTTNTTTTVTTTTTTATSSTTTNTTMTTISTTLSSMATSTTTITTTDNSSYKKNEQLLYIHPKHY